MSEEKMKDLSEDILKYEKFISTIHAAYRVTTSTTNIKEYCFGILKIAKHAFSAKYCSLSTIDPNKHNYIKTTINKDKKYSFKKGTFKSLLSEKEKKVLKTGKKYKSQHTIIIPLIFKRIIGVFAIKRKSSAENFTEKDNKFARSLAENAAITLKNFQLYEEQQKTIFGTVQALNEFLNRYTTTSNINLGWARKVLQQLAKQLNLNQKQVIAIEQAILLHDTGKIDIPQNLLNKDTPLTQQEKSLIKLHPVKSVDLLKRLQVLRPTIHIIIYHHEKYNGSGYPSGLKQKQIPIEARILAIIDAFDAMYFGRPYKKSLSLNETIAELRKNSGIQFDPKIVETFIKTLRRKEIKKYLKK